MEGGEWWVRICGDVLGCMVEHNHGSVQFTCSKFQLSHQLTQRRELITRVKADVGGVVNDNQGRGLPMHRFKDCNLIVNGF